MVISVIRVHQLSLRHSLCFFVFSGHTPFCTGGTYDIASVTAFETSGRKNWPEELYSAASAQLYDRYSIHPDAEQQGIFLAIWFGDNEIVAGRKNHGIKTAQELKLSIEAVLPVDLYGLIDVFVLDVSRHSKH
ncbi:hypothetical protein [Dickeya zeae]|uniref:hypothetical protein n=1 Tax=Dickeya zeae TaxID=204042 RepID=UPI001EE68C10|nr:hypothetical protein [Dickeya zeae]